VSRRFVRGDPAFEAAPSIATVVQRVLAMRAEVVVVDDGSEDANRRRGARCGVPC